MSLAPGARLGVYEVVAAIGPGGMGEVYRARDTDLGRQVAIKVLPDTFAHDPDRLARFEREARTLATLNHPHIAQIYGLEKAGGVGALVMALARIDTPVHRLSSDGPSFCSHGSIGHDTVLTTGLPDARPPQHHD